MKTWAALAALAATIVGCKVSSRTPASPPPRRVVVSFQGVVDAATGAVRITRATPAASAGFDEVPVVSDGRPGFGPPDTVELVTEQLPVAPDPRTIPGGCGTYDGFEGFIRLRSFYPGTVLRNAYVELTYLSRVGREACNSAEAPAGLSSATGLFSYGTLGVAGSSLDSAVVPWRFRLPDQSSFSFGGRVVADLVTDSTPPTVASVTPAAGRVGVDPATIVSVAFGEPVDPVTVTTATFSVSGPDGAVDGTIAADAALQVFTFRPAVPLRAEALYTVGVASGVRDLAGNALASAFTSTFYTVSSPQVLLAPTSAPVLNHAVAFDSTGTSGIAAWSATTTAGTAIVYSTWDGTAWSGGAVLATEPGNSYGSPLRVAVDANGQFLLVWCTSQAVRAARFQSGALLGSIVDLPLRLGTKLTSSPLSSDLAASSPAPSWFLVARVPSDGLVTAWAWDGSSWSDETSVGNGWWEYQGRLVGLSGGTLYWLGSDGTSIRASTFLGASWGPPVAVTTWSSSGNGSPTTLAVARGTRTVLGFATSSGHVWAGTGEGTSFGSFVDVTGTNLAPYQPFPLAAGAYADEYAVAWVDPTHGTGSAVFGSGTTWPTSPAQLFSSGAVDVGVAGYGSGAFAAAFTVTDPGSSTASVWVVPSGGSANARTWQAPIVAENGAATAREPAVSASGTGAVVHWTQADASGHELMVLPWDGAPAGNPVVASPMQAVPGSAANVRMAADGHGDVMAVWTQEDAGSTSVFAALHAASGWSAPVRVAARAASPDVASNGTGFLVVAYAESSTSPGARDAIAVPWAGGAFGAIEVFAGGIASPPVWPENMVSPPRVASDGTDYAAAWMGQWGDVMGAFRVDGAWRTPTTVGSGSKIVLAGRSGAFLWVWIDAQGQYVEYRRATSSGASWLWDPVRALAVDYVGTLVSADEVAVAAGSSRFLVAARGGDEVVAWPVVGDEWTIPPRLTLATGNAGPCDGLRVAANGDRHLVGWNCADDLETVETDGTSAASRTSHLRWAFTCPIPTARAFALAAGPATSFRLLFSSAADSRVYWRESVGGAWNPATRLDDRSEPARSTVDVSWDGGAYVAAWHQASAADPIVDDLVARWAW